ncbi:MAG TPA: hypothetical protein VG843_06040 [Rhizomicrobium sp.]|jgi:hypothetical protein|nr:hypothetical protein [Rhizomicrobium sp.]
MDEQSRAELERRRRSIALALVLGALVLLVFLMSIVKWGGHILP